MNKERKRIYLSPPHMSGRELLNIEEVFASNWIAPLGPQVDAFEKEIASYLGVQSCTALISGTAALHLALVILGIKKGDRVFCSALTFAATANSVVYVGAEPVFIDSDLDTWNMSVKALRNAFYEAENEGKLPKAIIVVNIYGQSADLEPIINLCNDYQVPVIEDAAESLGATYKGKKSGSLGKIGVLSFNGNKIITTSGGGAIVSDDPNLITRARYLATQARQPTRHYEHTELGYNYRMSNVLAGIGCGQLEVLDERVVLRRAVFERYSSAFKDCAGFDFMPEAKFGRSTRWLSVMIVDPELCGFSRDQIIEALEAENVEARPVWKPMQLQPLYQRHKYYAHNDGVSERLFELGLCLPSGSNLTEEDQERVIDVIRHLVK